MWMTGEGHEILKVLPPHSRSSREQQQQNPREMGEKKKSNSNPEGMTENSSS